MKTVSKQKTGWVCTPKDFLDLGNRASVDQALYRLVNAGKLRRIGRGLYDVPRMSKLLKRLAPADLYSAIAAVARRDDARIMRSGSAYANLLGLTNQVPAKVIYDTDGVSRILKIDGRTVRFRHAPPKVVRWTGKPGAPAVQALRWLGPHASKDPDIVSILKRVLPDYVKFDLLKGISYLPTWMRPIIHDVTNNLSSAQ